MKLLAFFTVIIDGGDEVAMARKQERNGEDRLIGIPGEDDHVVVAGGAVVIICLWHISHVLVSGPIEHCSIHPFTTTQ